MKEVGHYTEEDLQNYFSKTFAGDVKALEEHVSSCERCSKNFEAYSSVWSFAKDDLPTEGLKIDLAYTVANKVFAAKQTKPVFEKVMYGVFICLGIACFILCVKYLVSHSIPAPFILLAIPFGLYFWLAYKETAIVKQKFSIYLDNA